MAGIVSSGRSNMSDMRLGDKDERAAVYLARAINQWQLRKGLPPLGDGGDCSIIGFNDAHRRDFADIAAVLKEARQLARADYLGGS